MSSGLMLFDRVLSPLVEEAVHELEKEHIYHAVTGVLSSYDGQQLPDSATTNQIQFQLPVPSADTLLDACIYFEAYFDVTCTFTVAAGAGQDIAINNLDGMIPRSFPLNNMIDTLQLQINSHQSTHQSSALKPLQERLLTLEVKRDLMDGCPVFPETESCFHMQTLPGVREQYPLIGPGFAAGQLTAAAERQIVSGGFKSHRSFGKLISYGRNVGNTTTVATVRYTIREPLLHPLLEAIPGKRALHNVQSYLGVNMRLNPSIVSSVFYDRFTAANALTANHVYALVAPTAANYRLLYRTIATDGVTIPNTRVYPYMKYVRQVSQTKDVAIATAATYLQTFNYTCQGTVIPDTIAIYISRQRLFGTNSENQFDMTTMRIKKLTLKMQNDANLLASSDPFQLYNMSLKNGLKIDWYDWYYGGKCIVLVKPGEDFRAVSGVNTVFNLQVIAECEAVVDDANVRSSVLQAGGVNTPPATADEGNGIDGTYEMNVVQVLPSFLTFNGFTVTDNDGFRTDDVANALQGDPEHLGEESDPNRKMGGSFNFKRFFKKVWKGIKRYSPIVNHYAQVIGAASKNPVLQGAAKHAEMFNDTVNDIRNKPYIETAHGYHARNNPRDQQIEPSDNVGRALKMGGRARKFY